MFCSILLYLEGFLTPAMHALGRYLRYWIQAVPLEVSQVHIDSNTESRFGPVAILHSTPASPTPLKPLTWTNLNVPTLANHQTAPHPTLSHTCGIPGCAGM
ncbi:hypothetical protein LY78DRAFT_363213 [Colletotrichum sublineola]|nr:hypothetical protein LY78DRAFT_363213 [Colletotrichum sublineola]